MKCPLCSHLNQSGSSFCCECGTIFDEQQVPRDAKRCADRPLFQDGYTAGAVPPGTVAQVAVSEDKVSIGQASETAAQMPYSSGTEEMQCPNCKAMNARNAVQCGQCATALVFETPPQTPPQANPRADKDKSYLRYLSILCYIMGAINAVFAMWNGLMLLLVIRGMVTDISRGSALGLTLDSFLSVLVLFFLGKSIAKRRNWLICMVIAFAFLAKFPVGTALSIVTIIVLKRPMVKAMFKDSSMSSLSGEGTRR